MLLRVRQFAALPFLLVAACGGDDGSAPVISALTYAPTTAPIGSPTTVSGMFQFTDADGDLEQVGVDVILPAGSRQELPRSDIQGVAGLEAGPVSWALVLTPPSAGSYTLELYVVDAADHASNRLAAVITAP